MKALSSNHFNTGVRFQQWINWRLQANRTTVMEFGVYGQTGFADYNWKGLIGLSHIILLFLLRERVKWNSQEAAAQKEEAAAWSSAGFSSVFAQEILLSQEYKPIFFSTLLLNTKWIATVWSLKTWAMKLLVQQHITTRSRGRFNP